jgi:nucleosome assembly protein 1-like 1
MTAEPKDTTPSTIADASEVAAAEVSNPLSGHSVEENAPAPGRSFEERMKAEMDVANDMKISELKMKLMAKGVLTASFCEKAEFVRAYAELVVKEKEDSTSSCLAVTSATTSPWQADTAEDENDDDEDDDDGLVLPECVQQRVDKLKMLNDQREDLMKDYLIERVKLEAKYHELSQPLYQQRKEIVLGMMDDEIANEYNGDTDGNDIAKGIPQFWVVALSQMPVTAQMITERDINCLGYLQDVTCSDHESGEGFTLTFHFAPNDYFENETLTKRYDVPNLLTADEPILKNVEGCDIRWKSGKSLTFVEVSKQQRGKGKNTGQVRTVTRKEKSESFFHFFTPPKMPSLDTMDEQEAVSLEAAFEEDYDIAQAFRSHVIPKAVMWFAGDAMEKEMEAAMVGMEWPQGVKASSPSGGDENPECKQS